MNVIEIEGWRLALVLGAGIVGVMGIGVVAAALWDEFKWRRRYRRWPSAVDNWRTRGDPRNGGR